jgi:hypothetical protein
VNKKKQKNFDNPGAGMFERQWPEVEKVFCAAFFQKSGYFLSP